MHIVPVFHWGRYISAFVVLAACGWLVWIFATSENMRWGEVLRYMFDGGILTGLVVTLQLTAISMIAGTILGVIAAIMRMSVNPVLRYVSNAYIWFFRGTPLLVQIILWFNIGLFIPTLHLGFTEIDMNSVITSFVAASLALSLNEGAYMAEIVRAGITSVHKGQTEAASALGLNPAKTMRRIILPQALRIIIPPTGNQAIGMLKATSLVSVIAASELLTQAQIIYMRNYLVIELLFVVSIWYLIVTTVASIGQHYLEQHFSPDTRPDGKVRTAISIRAVRNLGTLGVTPLKSEKGNS
ncbi:amino acid ABC transporter permease [Nitratireductor indicus]|uniref:amino acid ABC transporter permease n=1 Tax=Nitratireductor indicus TaxID=721133 RepID=UPI002876AF64|nr:amino acid ABC transporter permease [Nitratireductor indicus]MDS1138778.1 amino acid ABC transporter permease [Nitratireductor indicus]